MDRDVALYGINRRTALSHDGRPVVPKDERRPLAVPRRGAGRRKTQGPVKGMSLSMLAGYAVDRRRTSREHGKEVKKAQFSHSRSPLDENEWPVARCADNSGNWPENCARVLRFFCPASKN